jgi:type I restriction enzyme S subunit
MNTDLFWDQVRKKTHGAAKINLNTGWLNDFDVLLPSITGQARIVAILDKFDALTNSITEGLPREIKLRQQQYEYYRDLLLSFPKAEVETELEEG